MNNLFRAHADRKSTGTALLGFSDNSIGKIYFNSGTATAARLNSKQGREALLAMNSLSIESSVFHDNMDAVNSDVPLGSIKFAVESVERPPQPVASSPESPTTPELTPETAPARAKPRTVADLSLSQKNDIATLLTEHIGPVAHIVVKKLDPDMMLSAAIDSLESVIRDSANAAQFSLDARKTFAE